MFPTHQLKEKRIKEIRVVKLGSISEYNIMEPHRHDYVELFFFQKGGGFHEIDFSKFEVYSNSIHIVSVSRVHQLKRALNSEGYIILFHQSIFDKNQYITQFLFDLDSFDVNEYNPVFSFDDSTQKELNLLVKSLWDIYNSDDPLKDQFILNKLSLICLYCLKNAAITHLDSSKDQEIYLKYRKLLRLKFKEIKKVSEYADLIGITPRKLNKIVSTRTGLSTSSHIQKQTILEAKRLLNTGISSKEVAFELNFEDPAYFSKFFKKQTGYSPSDFLKTHH